MKNNLIEERSAIGSKLQRNMQSQWLLAEIVHQYHERMNGSGYPRQLKGDEIILEARMLAVSNVLASMTPHRPYRSPLGIEAALDELEQNKEILDDAAVVAACLRLFREETNHGLINNIINFSKTKPTDK